MSESSVLGAADAERRWFGLRATQVVVALVSTLVAMAWLVLAHLRWWLLVVAVVIAAGALPAVDGITVAELGARVVRFWRRPHWRHVAPLAGAGDRSSADGPGSTPSVALYELEHRGRLDLSGGDRVLADALSDLCDALALRSSSSHLSLHVRRDDVESTTHLALGGDVVAPEHWRRVTPGPRALVDATRLERWYYLRGAHGVVRCYRIVDFGRPRPGHSLLGEIQRRTNVTELAVHVDVVPAARARRLSARAVHQLDSDVAAAGAIGFRRSALTARRQSRLGEREELVARGHALVRLAVYLTLEASDLASLREAHRSLWRQCHDAGVRLERGWGCQGPWWSHHLPGGASW